MKKFYRSKIAKEVFKIRADTEPSVENSGMSAEADKLIDKASNTEEDEASNTEEESLKNELTDIWLSRVALSEINKLIREDSEAAAADTRISARSLIRSVGDKAEVPIYGPVLATNTIQYRIAEPLYISNSRTKVHSNYTGIYLEKGFYKIEYEGSTQESERGGLAIFDLKENFQKLIVWRRGTFNTEGIAHFSVSEPSVLAYTNSEAEFMPEGFKGAFNVTLTKIKRLDNRE